MKLPYKKMFFVCTGERCNNPDRGEERGEFIRGDLKDLNKKLGRKKTVRICASSCLDLCDDGPNIVVYPEGDVHSHQTRESALRLYHNETSDEP
jgi:(2Fe-2S) ferredoxin